MSVICLLSEVKPLKTIFNCFLRSGSKPYVLNCRETIHINVHLIPDFLQRDAGRPAYYGVKPDATFKKEKLGPSVGTGISDFFEADNKSNKNYS